MSELEKKLSNYIDSLNEEKQPDDDEFSTDNEDLSALYQTVKIVRLLKEPTEPQTGFERKLVQNVTKYTESPTRKKWTWFATIASVAALFLFVMNGLFSITENNIVSAMERAFKDVEAYHGVIEIIDKNENGEDTTRTKLEIWTNKSGQYFIKGLEGSTKDMITVNSGDKKWQIDPQGKNVHTYPAFPDSDPILFEIGNEINNVKNALSIKETGEATIAGRQTTQFEVTPDGGSSYKIWVDKETNLPLQKQTAMHNARQTIITYTQIEFTDQIPSELFSYQLPEGYEEINDNAEQIVHTQSEVEQMVGFTAFYSEKSPSGYHFDKRSVSTDRKTVKTYYTGQSKILVVQHKLEDTFKASNTATIGKLGKREVEIHSHYHDLDGGQSNLSALRWQENDFELTVMSDGNIDELKDFTSELIGSEIMVPSEELIQPQIEVPYDLGVEENDQKSVDAGSSPWRLDPVFSTQVFVSLLISPNGIEGNYPIDIDDIHLLQNDGQVAIVEVNSEHVSIGKVYLKRLVRQDESGIWTIVGYDE